MSNTRVGVIALVVILVGCYLGFTKDIPFTKPFEVDAVFQSANSIRPGSVVRIAGVNVGKVQRVAAQEGTDAAVVTLAIDDAGLPLHADATAKIRPRIFLEGNFFVDLKPGTPSAPVLESGDTIKVTQTSTPVQLDQVLTALQDSTRQDLRVLLDELGTALGDEPTAAQDRHADPSVRGETAAQSFNDAYQDLAPAELSTAQVNQALLGAQPARDLRRLLRGLSRATAGLGRNEAQLRDLVTNLNGAMRAFAAEQDGLRASIRELAPTLQTANAAFDELNAAFPPTRAFAREILPGVRETAATIDAGFPWVRQFHRLVGQDELGGLAEELQPAARSLAGFVDASTAFFPQADRLSRCIADVVLPTGDVVIQDEFPTGQPNYREFAYGLVGLAGEGADVDGNGPFVHFQPGGGTTTVRSGQSPSGVVYSSAFPGVATRPVKPSRTPPLNTDTPCYQSDRPELNGQASARGEFGTVISGPRTDARSKRRAALAKEGRLEALRARLRPFGTREGAK